MKNLLAISVIMLLYSCQPREIKFIRKKIQDPEVTLVWYYVSRGNNGMTDIIDFEKNKQRVEILRAQSSIADVSLREDTIKLRLAYPTRCNINVNEIRKEALGYLIVVDTTADYTDMRFLPVGIRINYFKIQ